MGAYFKTYKNSKFIKKTLLKKKGGSPYPTINDFNEKISLITKYLGEFVVDTKVIFDGKSIRVEQPVIDGRRPLQIPTNKNPGKISRLYAKVKQFIFRNGNIIGFAK